MLTPEQEAIIDKLAEDWGINGRRSATNDADVYWMKGYQAACRQIKAELNKDQ